MVLGVIRIFVVEIKAEIRTEIRTINYYSGLPRMALS